MGNQCEWCKRKLDDTQDMTIIDGKKIMLCENCISAHNNSTCIKCNEISDPLIDGKCVMCLSVESAEIEMRKQEVAEGLGVDILSELTSSVVFTEEDYERWLTFGQDNLSPEIRRKCKRELIKKKLVNESNWSIEQFEDNISDIEKILEDNSYAFINGGKFILWDPNSTDQEIAGSILAYRGNVYLIEA